MWKRLTGKGGTDIGDALIWIRISKTSNRLVPKIPLLA
jgi:hypothetical protein